MPDKMKSPFPGQRPALTPPPRDTEKEMFSHDVHVIRDVLTSAKFRHTNDLVASAFTLLLEEHVREKQIVKVRDLCNLLFQLSLQCEQSYPTPEDFMEMVPFSRDGIHEVLNCDTDMPFYDILDEIRMLASDLEHDLIEAPGVKID